MLLVAASADDSGLFLCKEPRILEEAEEEYEEEVAKRMMPTMQQQRSNVRIVSGVSLCPERLGEFQACQWPYIPYNAL